MSETMEKLKLLQVVSLLLTLCAGTYAKEQGREAIPAVVNPVFRSELRQTISLDGEWDFATDPEGIGQSQNWYLPDVPLPSKTSIQVPGCWEAQGVGGVGVNNPLFSTEQTNKPIVGCYVGTAWYKKQITIPPHWKGKELWLKFGGVNAQGWFWVNGTYLNHDKSYCGTFKYRVTDLVDADGKLVIAAKVRNDVLSGKGLLNYVQKFGGLYRSVELDAAPSVSVDYAYVDGDFDAKSAAVHVTLLSTDTRQVKVELKVTVNTLDGKRAGQISKAVTIDPGQVNEAVLSVPLNPFNAWSPKHPNLYRADIVLERDGQSIDGWVERFGVRKWEVRGGDFYMNNKKHMVRGFGDDAIYPLTLASPADRETHMQHLFKAKRFGFNYVRHHTHCELPEFFDAADEVGIMVQPELPYWGANNIYGANASWGPEWARYKDDLWELVTHYRRYVSMSTYCSGNEGHLGSPVDKEIYALAKQLDPTRLFLHQDGGHNTAENSDFSTGPFNIWFPGKGSSASRPWFAHEYLNLAVDRDPRLAPQYTGAQLPPIPADSEIAQLEAVGMDVVWRDKMLDSGRYLQRLWQKKGLESARLDTACDGYIYWTIVDVDFVSDQGLLNQFWGVKKTTPEFFYQFNSPTTILAAHDQKPIGADQRILAEGDTFKVDLWISHFDDKPLKKAVLTWRVEAGRRVLKKGRIKNIDAAVGDVKQVGVGSFVVKGIDKPVKVRLVCGIEGTAVRNAWNLWLFPRFEPKKNAGSSIAASEAVYDAIKHRYPGLMRAGSESAELAKVLITDRMDGDFLDSLQAGKSVLLVSLDGPEPGLIAPWWMSGFAYHKPAGYEHHAAIQVGTAVDDHPAFGDFPHDGHLNHLFFRLIDNTIKCSDQEYRQVEKLMVNHGKSSQGYLAHVFQAKAGTGKLLACGLDVLSENVEAAYLLDQFIRYVRSPLFLPEGEFDMERILQLRKFVGNCNGFSETVLQYHQEKYDSFLGPQTMDIARFSQGQKEVAWLTHPVPEKLEQGGDLTFRWVAALGFISEPENEFNLMLGDNKLLTFGVTHDKTTWRSDDNKVILRYLPKGMMAQGQDSSGLMELKVPANMLNPGDKALLRVVAPQSDSRRWFGLYHFESD